MALHGYRLHTELRRTHFLWSMIKYRISSCAKSERLTHTLFEGGLTICIQQLSKSYIRISLNGNLILISELQRHVHYIGKQYPAMSDLTSTGFVVTKMQIPAIQDGAQTQRQHALFLSVQIKEEAKKSGSSGTCYPLL